VKKDRLAIRLAPLVTSAAVARLAGRYWWTVLVVLVVVMGLTYGVVVWLAMRSTAKQISTPLIVWEALTSPEKRRKSS
jgi:Na+/H+-dicarboxylate symporter